MSCIKAALALTSGVSVGLGVWLNTELTKLKTKNIVKISSFNLLREVKLK
jgi:hypothetical protein